MKFKFFILFAILSNFLLAAENSTINVNESDSNQIDITLAPRYVSQYDYRGQMLGTNSLIIPLDFDADNFNFEVWTLNYFNKKSNQEIDFSGNYSFKVSNEVTIRPGLTVYTYPKQDSEHGFFIDYDGIGAGYYSSELEPSIALDFYFLGIKFSPQFAYDRETKSSTYELNTEYDCEIKELNSEIDFFAILGTTNINNASKVKQPPSVIESFTYFNAGFLVPYKLSNHFTIKAGWQYDSGNGYVKRAIRPVQYMSIPLSKGVFSLEINAKY
jgi:hypothetical protein